MNHQHLIHRSAGVVSGKQGEDETADDMLQAYSTREPKSWPLPLPDSHLCAGIAQLETVTLLNRLSLTAVSTLPPAKSHVAQSSDTYGTPVALKQEFFSVAPVSFSLKKEKKKKK